MQFHYRASAQLYAYRGVTVTGDHAVSGPSGRFVRVCHAPEAVAVPDSDLAFGGSVGGNSRDDVLHDLITTNHRIFVFVRSPREPGPAARVVEFGDYLEADESEDGVRAQRLALLNAQSDARSLPGVVATARGGGEVQCHSPLRPTSYGGAAGLSGI